MYSGGKTLDFLHVLPFGHVLVQHGQRAKHADARKYGCGWVADLNSIAKSRVPKSACQLEDARILNPRETHGTLYVFGGQILARERGKSCKNTLCMRTYPSRSRLV
jgi:hypothetical protein